jgi:predicted phospho-2-dehydro-3-deoxyheptonate aldolase
MIGKAIRMARLMDRESKKFLILPVDHGVTIGPIHGIKKLKHVVNWAANGGATAVVEHKGMVKAGFREKGKDIGLIVHLSASTNLTKFSNTKTLVGTVEEAIKLGADGVSVHINIGDINEREMLSDFGKISKEASKWGMPLLAMVYPRGNGVSDSYDPKLIAHCARIGAELGADVVKVSYTGDVDSFRNVVECTPVPVVIAGGEKMDSDIAVLKMVEDAMKAGAAGISIGRNIFQHDNPQKMMEALSLIIKDGKSSEEAYEKLKD